MNVVPVNAVSAAETLPRSCKSGPVWQVEPSRDLVYSTGLFGAKQSAHSECFYLQVAGRRDQRPRRRTSALRSFGCASWAAQPCADNRVGTCAGIQRRLYVAYSAWFGVIKLAISVCHEQLRVGLAELLRASSRKRTALC